MSRRERIVLSIVCLLLGSACAAEPLSHEPSGDLGIDEELAPVGPMGKEDGAGRAGPLVATNTGATQVWTARNKWEDTATPAARKVGLAWAADSGLDWDEKYSAWIESLPIVDAAAGYHTFELTTPWGKTVLAPVLECAETAIFLRATFAAWHELPFFMEAQTPTGARVYFGHFGIRTAAGRYAGTPDFALRYKDHSSLSAAELAARGWPSDAALRTRAAAGGGDEQLLPGGGHFGAYLDEIHLNKRAGHLTIYLLNYFGSVNLTDAANTYNLVPDAIHAGDLLVHRWQRSGIGDAKMLKRVERRPDDQRAVNLMSGSMPRRQPKIYDEVASKGYFTSEDTGGPGENSDGDAYYKLGGGAKRWRVTKNVAGRWTNTWMADDEASWINDQDRARITARPAHFEAILSEVPLAEKAAALRGQIDDARAHLLAYPASCAARDRRERAFAALYELAPRLGKTPAQLDAELRTIDDYVFAPLDYAHAKTCCWNSSTAQMAEVILDHAEDEQTRAAAAGTCVAPTVFRSEPGGYQRWASFAQATGRQAAWRPWSEDESCPQRGVAEDTVAETEAQAYCALDGAGAGACTDAFESNDSAATARAVGVGVLAAQVCGGDHDHYALTVAAGASISARASFSHAAGDLDLELLSPSGARLQLSESTSDVEIVSATHLPAGRYVVHVYGYAGATGAYQLTLQ